MILFSMLDYGSCFLYLLATLPVITFPSFFAFIHMHECMAK